MNKTKARSATVKTFPQFLRRQCGQPSGARRFRLNAAGGGLLRDVLVRDEPLLFKPGQFYVLAGFVGCLLFTLLVVQLKTDATLAAVITIVVTFALRVLAIQFNWKSPRYGASLSRHWPPHRSRRLPRHIQSSLEMSMTKTKSLMINPVKNRTDPAWSRSQWPAAGRRMANVLLAMFIGLPTHAQASMFKGEALDKVADVLTWVVLIVAPLVGITVFWLVHILPEKIAERREHPQAKAIQCLCLLSLVFGGLLWPLAWLWAYSKPVLYKLAYGTDRVPHAHAPVTSPAENEDIKELQQLRLRVAELELQLDRKSPAEGGKA